MVFYLMCWKQTAAFAPRFQNTLFMKTQIILTLAAICALAVAPASAQSGNETKPAPVAQKYTCEMHPEVISDKPGKCPKCGMKLVPVKASPTPKN